MNLLDLLLICLAAWRKGQTRGELVSRSDINDSEDFDSPAITGTAKNLVADQDGQASWNQNSIRMLSVAHEWHAQRRQGIVDRKQYPILTLADSLRLGTISESTLWLDTFDMVVHINGQQVQLNPDSITIDDENYWHTQFMPKVADVPGSLRDLRFYSREGLGL